MRRRLALPALAVLAAAAMPTADAAARTAPRDVLGASRSAVAVRAGDDLVTGFRLGDDGRVVTAAAKGPFQVTARTGESASAKAVSTSGGVTVLEVEGTELKPLKLAPKVAKRVREAYVIGSPVGYGEAARRVPVEGRGARLTVRSALRDTYAGAPVVDANGRVLGMVGTKVKQGRQLVAAAALRRAASAGGVDDDSGRPLWQLVLLGVVLLVLVLGLITLAVRLRARRRGRAGGVGGGVPAPVAFGDFAATQAESPLDPSEQPTTHQPVVRRREPAPDDDFEILFRAPKGEDG
ncbi:MAG TPA: serine protease [Solirubrobacteraceae bacterium]